MKYRGLLGLIFIFLSTYGLVSGQEYAKILDSEITYEINSAKSVDITHTYKIQINSEEGYQHAVYQEYTDKFRKIKDVEITIKNLDGKKITKFGKAAGHEFGFNQSYEIDDSKIFIINPKFRNFPFVMEVVSSIHVKGFISLPTWVPRRFFNLGVAKSTLEVKSPVDLEINVRNEFLKPYVYETTEGIKVRRYEVLNLEAIPKKSRYKDFYDHQPKVLISPKEFSLDNEYGNSNSWTEFGNWYLKLNNEPYELTDETKKFIDGLDKNNMEELISTIYYYMQDRTRYISIQLGIGGFKSIATKEVESNGYGDCKALTTYMKNMLDYAGVSSNYILVRAGDDAPDVISEFPSNQFNHVFLGVPLTDTVYLECTSQMMPSDYTGTFTDDRNVLWIAEDNSKIIRSRIYTEQENIRQNVFSVNLDDKGNANMQLTQTNKGIFYDEIMTYKQAPDDYIETHNQDKFHYKDFELKEFDFSTPSRDSTLFVVDYNLEVNGLGRTIGDRLILPMNISTPLDKIVDFSDLKQYAAIPRAMTIEDNVTLELPDQYWIYNLPEEVNIQSEYGSYNLDVSTDGKNIIINRKIQFRKGEYTQENFDKFNEYFKRLKKIERRKLVLNNKT